MNLIKLGLTKKIKLSGFLPVTIRRNSTDLPTFRQIFLDEEYRFDLKNPKNIVDLGANVGFASIYFYKFCPDSLFIAVEPDSENFNQLLKNTAALKNITCINKAVWSSKCTLYLTKSKALGDWGVQTNEQQTEFPVETITIEQIISQFGLESIDVLKMDIETAEEEVFRDAKWLNKVKVLIVETHDRFKPASSNNFIKAIAKLDKFNIHLSGENIVIYNLSLLDN
ncbi:MAG: FkbM family methyltransferase [Flavobacteriales bacterium]